MALKSHNIYFTFIEPLNLDCPSFKYAVTTCIVFVQLDVKELEFPGVLTYDL